MYSPENLIKNIKRQIQYLEWGVELWAWLANRALEDNWVEKEEWPGWKYTEEDYFVFRDPVTKQINTIENGCFACELTLSCNTCAVWCYPGEKCYEADSDFQKWRRTLSHIDKAYTAARIARKHREAIARLKKQLEKAENHMKLAQNNA